MSPTFVPARNAPAAEYDRSLAWAALLLAASGLVMVYSASIVTAEANRYTGNSATWFLLRHATFLGVPRCDLADEASLRSADAVVLGAPYDAGASYRAGARFGLAGFGAARQQSAKCPRCTSTRRPRPTPRRSRRQPCRRGSER